MKHRKPAPTWHRLGLKISKKVVVGITAAATAFGGLAIASTAAQASTDRDSYADTVENTTFEQARKHYGLAQQMSEGATLHAWEWSFKTIEENIPAIAEAGYTSVQTAIYFLLVTVCPEMHLLYAGNVAAITFLFSIYFLFKSYQQAQASGYLFYSFLFIGAGSILFPQLTFFSVLWLFEAHRFQSLTFRSFCGALVGWTMPYWMLFGHAFFYDQMELFYHPFKELATFGDIFNLQILQPWELATLGYLFVLFIVSAAHCVVAGFEDKIRTRAYLQFLIDVTLFLFVLIVLQPSQCSNLLPLLMISNSILIGHLFVLTNNKTSNIFFIVATVCLILLFGFNVWTLL